MPKFFVDAEVINKQKDQMNSSGKDFQNKDIPKNQEVDIRVLPGTHEMKGSFYLKVQTIWMNNKFYISPRTFGERCPILDTVDKERKSGKNKKILALLDSKLFSSRDEYWMQILVLEPEYNKKNELIDCAVVGDAPKIGRFTYQIVKQMNEYFTHRQYQNGTPFGVFDREKGYNCILKKVVKDDQTSYTVMMWTQPMEIDKKFFEDDDLFIDIYKEVYDQILPEDELEEAWLEFIDSEEEEKPKKSSSNKTASKKKVEEEEDEDEVEEEEDEDEEEEKPKRRSLQDRLRK
jgi:hypothetical protein